MSYYGRRQTRTERGSAVFAQPEDRDAEDRAKAMVEDLWDCTLHRYNASFAAIDWYAVRDERIVGWIEIKHRSHNSDKFATVFLNYRKYRALWEAWMQTGVPAVFVVAFEDRTLYINVLAVDPRNIKLGGCKQAVKANTDREPVIEVPVSSMKEL